MCAISLRSSKVEGKMTMYVEPLYGINDVSRWAMSDERWIGKWSQMNNKESSHHIPCHNIEQSTNIFMPHEFIFCDVAE